MGQRGSAPAAPRPQRPWLPQLSFYREGQPQAPKSHKKIIIAIFDLKNMTEGIGGGDQQKLKLQNMTGGLERQKIVCYFMT